MKLYNIVAIFVVLIVTTMRLFGQSNTNCFLQDHLPKYTTTPAYADSPRTTTVPTITVTLNGADTIGPVSPYVFGNAVAVWLGQDVYNPTLMNYLSLLAPNLIRYPGGSWSDGFFWGNNPGDLPDSIYVSGGKTNFQPQFGPSKKPSLDNYYNMRDQLGAQGLITVNYGYARYGLSANPVAQAAHYAADWVRFDEGRTKFWEIGNENAGIWEYGYQIDTAKNLDGQPRIITGQLYGKHFKVFVDSMKAAAAEIGATIYIGGQVIQDAAAASSEPGASWNAGFFSEVGDSADFYVAHDYFGGLQTIVRGQISTGRTEIISDINYINADISNKGAHPKPIAFTEWNCLGPDSAKTSIANGLQAVALFSEMLNNNVGMSCRWLIANWDADGMFYFNDQAPLYPLWSPRPDFFYVYYLERVTGDQVIRATVTQGVPGASDIIAYASRFTSGHTGVVIINQNSTTGRILKLVPTNMSIGSKYYVYSLTGMGSPNFADSVAVNSIPPTPTYWGPISNLATLKAWAYPTDTIKIVTPAKSAQFILIDNYITGVNETLQDPQIIHSYNVEQNYPNPFNPVTVIHYQVPMASVVSLKVYDVLGREVQTLVREERKNPGTYSIEFDGTKLTSGVYFYKFTANNFTQTKKMLLIK